MKSHKPCPHVIACPINGCRRCPPCTVWSTRPGCNFPGLPSSCTYAGRGHLQIAGWKILGSPLFISGPRFTTGEVEWSCGAQMLAARGRGADRVLFDLQTKAPVVMRGFCTVVQMAKERGRAVTLTASSHGVDFTLAVDAAVFWHTAKIAGA